MVLIDAVTAPIPAPHPFSSNGNIYVASSHDNGNALVPVKVKDESGQTSHAFPSVELNELGDVYLDWLDRRYDPTSNALTDL